MEFLLETRRFIFLAVGNKGIKVTVSCLNKDYSRHNNIDDRKTTAIYATAIGIDKNIRNLKNIITYRFLML